MGVIRIECSPIVSCCLIPAAEILTSSLVSLIKVFVKHSQKQTLGFSVRALCSLCTYIVRHVVRQTWNGCYCRPVPAGLGLELKLLSRWYLVRTTDILTSCLCPLLYWSPQAFGCVVNLFWGGARPHTGLGKQIRRLQKSSSQRLCAEVSPQ